MTLVLAVLGVLLLAVACWVLRGVLLIRKAKRLEAEIAGLDARAEAGRTDERARKTAAAVALGFVAETGLDTDHPAPVPAERLAVLEAVRTGDWEAAAAYLEAAGEDWQERLERLRPLAEAAAEDDAWLLAWRAARPADPTAALVHADTSVMVAWNVRGSQAGSRTTQEQFRLFHQLLTKARDDARAAQELADPADPTPYVVEQAVAMGLGYAHEDYRELWQRITDRAPRLLWSHVAGLQYWCAKWQGSHELAMEYARASAAAGKPGDLLTLIPLMAYFERQEWEDDLLAETYYKEPEIVAAVDAALADLAAAGHAHPGAPRMRHMLAYLLFWQDRDAEAVEQFRHVDGYIGAVPWTYAGEPKQRYLYARDWALDVTTANA
ncbi:hypothetical protein ABZ766_20390 [Streptomyces sp. NPDC006670]|uniref:hypothetical protein n=1 Tax=Streptomyces sp. NPDC006670 TaxID=3154476 RepID=UPI003406CF74